MPAQASEHSSLEASTLWGLLSRRARHSPELLALADERSRRLTFAQLLDEAEAAAAGLQELGVGEGTRVAWQLPTCVDAVVLSLALCRLGAVQIPIISLYREREVSHLLEATSAELFFIQRIWRGFDYEAMARSIIDNGDRAIRVMAIDDGLPSAGVASLSVPPGDPDAVRWLYSTSGTTTAPKIVRHSDGSLVAGGNGIAQANRYGAGDVSAVPYPYAHIGGPDHLVMALQLGIPQILIEIFDLDGLLPWMREERVTVFGGSTAHYLAMLAAQAGHEELVLPTLRVMNGGGAPKPPELFWRAKAELGVVIRHGYGMTECPMIAQGSVENTDEQLANTEGPPVVGCEVRVVDDEDHILPTDTEGHLQVRGPMLFKGYADAAQTAEAMTNDGFFRTGDRGVLRSDGCVVVTGRAKEMIIRKGENISPREIEDVLMTHPSITAVAVIGLADSERGERVCAVLELAPDAAPLDVVAIGRFCREQGLMVQKTPEQVEIVDALPRNPTMKILKRELVEQFSAQEG